MLNVPDGRFARLVGELVGEQRRRDLVPVLLAVASVNCLRLSITVLLEPTFIYSLRPQSAEVRHGQDLVFDVPDSSFARLVGELAGQQAVGF